MMGVYGPPEYMSRAGSKTQKHRKPWKKISGSFSSNFSILVQYSKSKLGKKFQRFLTFPSIWFATFWFNFQFRQIGFFQSSWVLLFSFWICYFRLLDCDYPTYKSMFKVAQIKSNNVHYICSEFKKFTKLISGTARLCLI